MDLEKLYFFDSDPEKIAHKLAIVVGKDEELCTLLMRSFEIKAQEMASAIVNKAELVIMSEDMRYNDALQQELTRARFFESVAWYLKRYTS
jgi:hypothetical protein